ncbi:MAG: translation initiation factor 2 [Ruminiclostridium sp.]|jgi:hypothetical protein|nr:translation initiation factor 2 [Ruminiclostridium sp.]
MVKGVTRQVVVVRSPDPKLFDQAIFLLRENLGPQAPSEREILRQAQQIADDYILSATPRGRRRSVLQPFLYTLLGGAAASVFWTLFFFGPLW